MELPQWSDENILELDSGGGCTAQLGTCYRPLLGTEKAEFYGT